MEELSKTEAGRIRLGAASERLNRTAFDLAIRDDVLPQGENRAEVVQRHHPEQGPPQFIPIPDVGDRMESVVGSPPGTEEDRRMGPVETDEHVQGGPMESKLQDAELDGGDGSVHEDGGLRQGMDVDLSLIHI